MIQRNSIGKFDSKEKTRKISKIVCFEKDMLYGKTQCFHAWVMIRGGEIAIAGLQD